MDHSASQLSPARAVAMILLAAGLAVAGWLGVRDTAESGTVSGRVIDGQGQNIAGARVEIEGLERGTVSEADGSFWFGEVPPGVYWLSVESPAGSGVSLTVRVRRLWDTELGVIVIPNGSDRD